MNVKQSSWAVLIHGRNAGHLVFVQWEAAAHTEHGTMWQVRFREPQLSTRISSDGGATFQDGIAFSRDALVPDTWHRAVERQAGTPLDVDLRRPEPPPEVLNVQLSWPNGWLPRPRVD